MPEARAEDMREPISIQMKALIPANPHMMKNCGN